MYKLYGGINVWIIFILLFIGFIWIAITQDMKIESQKLEEGQKLKKDKGEKFKNESD